ncbi:unnamed protein product [Cuscuta epithymum]|uniref:F-box domain-containing protein n=1 Tax=Cuscuta epithymum TaxID=186058 RepID=A0AAV0EP88_9ASTE|nr:unnamed protein product [Cuscuta epithymum]
MARSDRISLLPEDILDHILGFLPIQDIAKTAVLSTMWRDLWFTLRQLCFDRQFFRYFDNKCKASRYEKISCAFYTINKVILQHKGTIQKFVIDLSHVGERTIKSRSYDCDQWLPLVKSKGVEELHLFFKLTPYNYKLPNWVFSCSTLKGLHLGGFRIEPTEFPSTLSNLTSLYLHAVCFGPTNLPCYVVDGPMLKNLSFSSCNSIAPFKITARSLSSLTIKNCFNRDSGKILPIACDLISIRTLDVDYGSLEGLPVQANAINLELLKLSKFRFQDDVTTSAFVRLLSICPKLCKLEITYAGTDVNCIESLSELLKNLHSVAQTCKKLLFLELNLYKGEWAEILFINEMLASLPALEKVTITCSGPRMKSKILERVMCFARTSTKAKIVIYPS